MNRSAITANKNQFFSTYHMLKKIVEVCPDDVWAKYFHKIPFWYQVYHCAFFIDYWFRDEYETFFSPLTNVGNGILRSLSLSESDWWSYNES